MYLCLILLSGCNKSREETQPKTAPKAVPVIKQNTEPLADEKYSCEDLLKEIVFSSNLTALKKFRETAVGIENISEDKMTIEVYTKEMSDRTGELHEVENTVAWLEFIPETKKLYDITADPESPVELNYDKTLFSRHPLTELCGVKTTGSGQKKAEISCKEITSEMASGQECILPSTTFEKAYKDLIDKEAVNDSKYLPKQLPANNISIEINKSGLSNMEFKITAKRISIEMLYAGGTTEIAFEKQGNKLKRTIMYNAD